MKYAIFAIIASSSLASKQVEFPYIREENTRFLSDEELSHDEMVELWEKILLWFTIFWTIFTCVCIGICCGWKCMPCFKCCCHWNCCNDTTDDEEEP